MLSYRHGFHAGGPADVLKHAVLTFVLRYAKGKPTPLYVLDTHAGAGEYDLASPLAAKLAEHEAGIVRVLAAPEAPPELLADYLGLVRGANRAGELRIYPGSPELARALLRQGDRLELAELHRTDHAGLAARFDHVRGAYVTWEDGLAVLDARMPPPERRAVVLIDPSYEVKAELETVPAALARAHQRFGTGVFLLWYPVIERARTDALLARLVASGIRRQLKIELDLVPDGARRGMTGSGLVVINPPWTLPAAALEGLPWLARALGATGPWSCDWLVPE